MIGPVGLKSYAGPVGLESYVGPRRSAALDGDAIDYFGRAEALGGSFDLTTIDATYTESYVKTAISDMIAGLKADGVWSKITEMYLLAGVTFDGLMAKLKYDSVATLTNNNFVSGDLLAAGSGAGLKGDASSKFLNTSATVADVAGSGVSFSSYVTVLGDGAWTGMLDGSNAGLAFLNGVRNPNKLGVSIFNNGNAFEFPEANGFWCGVGTASQKNVYQNGTVKDSTSSAGTSFLTKEFGVFSRNIIGSNPSDATLSFVHWGDELTATDAANLSTRVNDLMTALGANVY
jgi:hypothetical protein